MPALLSSAVAFIQVSHSQPPKQSGLPVWQIVVAASVILTIVGSVIGLASFVSRLRLRRAERRVYEIVQAQISVEDVEKSAEEAKENAERVKEELRQLRELKGKLNIQVGKIPQEANRLYLVKQLEQLTNGLSRDFKEYVSIERQLRSLEPITMLDIRIREVIENSIVPEQKQRERRNVYVLLLLVILLAINLSPISGSTLVWRYFNILSNSPYWTLDAPAWMIVFGSIAVALLIPFVSSLLPRAQHQLSRLMRPSVLVYSGIALAILIGLGYYWRDNALIAQCYPISCGLPSVPYFIAGAAFNLCPLFGGLFLFGIFCLRRRQGAIPTI